MLRRTKPVATSSETLADGASSDGKGRPTPSRKEAQQAAKQRAKVARDPKQRSRGDRARQADIRREAMKRGDERYLPKRDHGPVRRFIRDYIDVRFAFAELALPIIFIGLLTLGTGAKFGGVLIDMLVLIVVLETAMRWFMLRRELKRRFPGQSLRGAAFYAFGRSLQLRFLRVPKPQVRIGEKLPDTYK